LGQQPNVPLRIEDLPRPSHHPPPARRWSPQRPGDLLSPEESRWGGAYATPGPDSGFAYSLLARRAAGERDDDTIAALATLVMARASHFGRAPVPMDAVVAEKVLELAGSSGDTCALVRGVAGSAERARELLEAVELGLLTAEDDMLMPAGSAEAAAGP
jgi:hypothetical protein